MYYLYQNGWFPAMWRANLLARDHQRRFRVIGVRKATLGGHIWRYEVRNI